MRRVDYGDGCDVEPHRQLLVRRGVPGIFVDSSLDSSTARRRHRRGVASMPDPRRPHYAQMLGCGVGMKEIICVCDPTEVEWWKASLSAWQAERFIVMPNHCP